MGRQRTFDEAEVIAQSASVFLRQGYEGTSIDDLLAATGLHRGSLYKAFASKRGLFLAALQRTLPNLVSGDNTHNSTDDDTRNTHRDTRDGTHKDTRATHTTTPWISCSSPSSSWHLETPRCEPSPPPPSPTSATIRPPTCWASASSPGPTSPATERTPMNTVTIIDNTLVVEPRGLDKFWALTRELRIPLGHVRGATVDPGAAHDYKGLRNPGLGVPGVKWAGTFTLDGERHFWNVTGSAATIVVQLADEHYDRLYLTVADPSATVDAINAAIATPDGSTATPA